jgi:hypothetical protein
MACISACHGDIFLSKQETSIFKNFFLTLFLDSEGGYVFYNQKPVCCEAYAAPNNLLPPGSPSHKKSVALQEGAFYWKKLLAKYNLSDKKSRNILLHLGDKVSSSNYIDVLLINQKLFLDTVKDELHLFQYILGPKLSSKTLLDALTSPENCFCSVLKENKVLTGIILGYKANNSLWVSRLETLEESLYTHDTPPFQTRLNAAAVLGASTEGLEDIYLFNQQDYSYPIENQPSFGYKTLKEEYTQLYENQHVSSKLLINSSAPFIFGHVENDSKNERFINDLEKTQINIHKLIASPQFLEDVIRELTGQNIVICTTTNNCIDLVKESLIQVNKIVAKDIWNRMGDFNSEFFSIIIESLEKNIDSIIPDKFFSSETLRFIDLAKRNIQEADKFFNNLSKSSQSHAIIPMKLYYNTLKEGIGTPVLNESLVTLEYQIFDPHDSCLAAQFYPSVSMDLSETIPGFAHGIKGMRIGETREIYIHPSLAYGVHTFLEKGIYLRVVVTLREIDKTKRKKYPELKEHDFTFLANRDFENECQKNYRESIQFFTSKLRDHYHKCSWIDFSSVISELKNIREDNSFPCIISDEEQGILNNIHWNIYFGRNVIEKGQV